MKLFQNSLNSRGAAKKKLLFEEHKKNGLDPQARRTLYELALLDPIISG